METILPALISFVMAISPQTAGISATTQISIPIVQAAQERVSAPRIFDVWVTAYSSSQDETDSTPNITASNKAPHDGVLAANFLKLGEKVKIPSLFGDKIFTVEDRMNKRKKNFVDIWMPTKQDALKFGIAKADIVLVD
ncbi:MAG: hypothetical protein Q7R98_02750 [Candidatus Jorgensenbacteria bacterium]|nr:hypothetical protein [Candidatus Jorgensenbacteria bacterium]